MKKPKNYQSGVAPIYIRITVKGVRAEVTTGRLCQPARWNARTGRATGTKEEFKALNSFFDQLQARVYEAHHQLVTAKESITAESLKNRFLGKKDKGMTLMEVFRDHNDKMTSLIGTEFTKGTAERYETSYRHTVDFLQWKYQVNDMELHQVDYTFISEYDYYLRSVRKCANNSTVKYLKNFGKIIRNCLANGWMDVDPFLNYKPKVKKVDRMFLSEKEVNTIANKKMVSERLSHVRDIFLFCCYTGLAYIDVKNLRAYNIITGMDGEKWIAINRQKTDVPSRIPLLPIASAILQRYRSNPICLNTGLLLPVLSNQKMNSYLKEIVDVCGIHKPITFHIARHTFATTITLLNGIPIESVSKMLGHRNIQTTQQYAKILDIKVGADMALLNDKYAAV